jgi:membrane protease YdiL (CAAX protease family)
MARTPLHRWWRPLAGTLLIVWLILPATLAVMFIAAVAESLDGGRSVFDALGDAAAGGPIGELAVNLILLSALTPVVLLAARVVQRRPAGSVISVVGRVRWRWLSTCCGLAFGYCVVSFVLLSGMFALFGDEPVRPAGQWPGGTQFLLAATVIVVLVPLQATAEEVAFRGWLVQAIGAWTLEGRPGAISRTAGVLLRTPWAAILVSAALFTSMHGYTGWAMLNIFCFGAVAGWLAVRTGGLEAGIALHIFTNLMGLLLLAASGRISDALRQGGQPWSSFAAGMLALGLYALAVVLVARRRRTATVSPS